MKYISVLSLVAPSLALESGTDSAVVGLPDKWSNGFCDNFRRLRSDAQEYTLEQGRNDHFKDVTRDECEEKCTSDFETWEVQSDPPSDLGGCSQAVYHEKSRICILGNRISLHTDTGLHRKEDKSSCYHHIEANEEYSDPTGDSDKWSRGKCHMFKPVDDPTNRKHHGPLSPSECQQLCDDDEECNQATYEANGRWGSKCFFGKYVTIYKNSMSDRKVDVKSTDEFGEESTKVMRSLNYCYHKTDDWTRTVDFTGEYADPTQKENGSSMHPDLWTSGLCPRFKGINKNNEDWVGSYFDDTGKEVDRIVDYNHPVSPKDCERLCKEDRERFGDEGCKQAQYELIGRWGTKCWFGSLGHTIRDYEGDYEMAHTNRTRQYTVDKLNPDLKKKAQNFCFNLGNVDLTPSAPFKPCHISQCSDWTCPMWCYCEEKYPWMISFLENVNSEWCPSDGTVCECDEDPTLPPVFPPTRPPIEGPPIKIPDYIEFDPLPEIKVIAPRIICGDWVPTEEELKGLYESYPEMTDILNFVQSSNYVGKQSVIQHFDMKREQMEPEELQFFNFMKSYSCDTAQALS